MNVWRILWIVAAWVVCTLPFEFCCLWPLRSNLKENGKAGGKWRALSGAAWACSLGAWLLLYALGAEPFWLFLLLPLTMAAQIPLFQKMTGDPMRFVYYESVLGAAASLIPAVILLGRTNFAQMQADILLLGAATSLLGSAAGAWMLENKALPFRREISTCSWRPSVGTGTVGVAMLVACYLNQFFPQWQWGDFVLLVLCGLSIWCAYLRDSQLFGMMVENTSQSRRGDMLERCVELQRAQYASMTEQMEKARMLKHDLRQHQRIMAQFLQNGDDRSLREYLTDFCKDERLFGEEIRICQNSAADAVLRYYVEKMRQAGARLDLSTDIREDLGVPPYDLCVALGNCMENALEAIAQAPEGKRLVRLRAVQNGQILSFVLGNAFDGERIRDADGRFLSTKRPGQRGIGLYSIEKIAEKYGGNVRTETENGMFRLSLILFGREA